MRVIGSLLLVLICLAGCMLGKSDMVESDDLDLITPVVFQSSNIDCTASENFVMGETQIAINSTRNVTIRLEDDRGIIVVPTSRDIGTTENDIDFKTVVYNESRVSPGEYDLLVIDESQLVIAEYLIDLRRNRTPIINVFCK